MFYLLPSSKRQSKITLRLQNSNGHHIHFDDLSHVRVRLNECAQIDTTIQPVPVWRRFKNSFWSSLEFWVLPPSVQRRIEDRGIVLSPLYGFLKVNDLIPFYMLTWEDYCNSTKVWDVWKPILKEKSKELFKDKVVLNLLGREKELLDLSTARKTVEFKFFKKDRRVKDDSRHKAYVLRYIAEKDLDISDLHKINFYDYRVKEIEEEGKKISVVMGSEGKYI